MQFWLFVITILKYFGKIYLSVLRPHECFNRSRVDGEILGAVISLSSCWGYIYQLASNNHLAEEEDLNRSQGKSSILFFLVASSLILENDLVASICLFVILFPSLACQTGYNFSGFLVLVGFALFFSKKRILAVCKEDQPSHFVPLSTWSQTSSTSLLADCFQLVLFSPRNKSNSHGFSFVQINTRLFIT